MWRSWVKSKQFKISSDALQCLLFDVRLELGRLVDVTRLDSKKM